MDRCLLAHRYHSRAWLLELILVFLILLLLCSPAVAETNLAWVCPATSTSITQCDSAGAWRAPTSTSRVYSSTSSSVNGSKVIATFGTVPLTSFVVACAADVPVGTNNRCGPSVGNWSQEFRRLRSAWSTEPPTCTAPRPTDETRTAQCVAPLVGSWTQTRTYTAAPFPTCWSAGAWLPVDPPAGTCEEPPPAPPPRSPQPILIVVEYDSCFVLADTEPGMLLEASYNGGDWVSGIPGVHEGRKITCDELGVPLGKFGPMMLRSLRPSDGMVSVTQGPWLVGRFTMPRDDATQQQNRRIEYRIDKKNTDSASLDLP